MVDKPLNAYFFTYNGYRLYVYFYLDLTRNTFLCINLPRVIAANSFFHIYKVTKYFIVCWEVSGQDAKFGKLIGKTEKKTLLTILWRDYVQSLVFLLNWNYLIPFYNIVLCDSVQKCLPFHSCHSFNFCFFLFSNVIFWVTCFSNVQHLYSLIFLQFLP